MAVRAPKGTRYKLLIDKALWDGSTFKTPIIVQDNDNDWDLVTIPLTSFEPSLDTATIDALRAGGVQMSNFYLQILGHSDDSAIGGNSNISGTFYLDAYRYREFPARYGWVVLLRKGEEDHRYL